jgi:hypothetical protein
MAVSNADVESEIVSDRPQCAPDPGRFLPRCEHVSHIDMRPKAAIKVLAVPETRQTSLYATATNFFSHRLPFQTADKQKPALLPSALRIAIVRQGRLDLHGEAHSIITTPKSNSHDETIPRPRLLPFRRLNGS